MNQVTIQSKIKAEIIRKQIYEIPNYFYIGRQKQFHEIQQLFKSKCQQSIHCFSTIQESAEEIISSSLSIIVCQIQLIKEIEDAFSQQIQNQRFLNILTYGYYPNWKKLINSHTGKVTKNNLTFESVVEQISYQGYFYKQKQFNNFFMLSRKSLEEKQAPIKTLQVMLYEQTNKLQIIKQFVRLQRICHGVYSEKQCQQLILDYEKGPLSLKQIINWYTRQSFFYRLLNKVLKSSNDPSVSLIVQPIFQDLFNKVKRLYNFQKRDSKFKKFKCFRGGLMGESQVQMFQKGIGCIVQNLGFMSTSIVEKIGIGFSSNVLFQIEVEESEKIKQNGWAFLQQYTSRKGQHEVLFNHLNSFKIVSVDLDKNIYNIRLKYGGYGQLMMKNKDELTEQQIQCINVVGQQIWEGQMDEKELIIQNNVTLQLSKNNQQIQLAFSVGVQNKNTLNEESCMDNVTPQ